MSLPPVVTKSWYHTGTWKTGKSLLAHYEQEWFDPSAVAPPSPPVGETATPYAAEPRLAASAMPQGVSALEHHQAYRALAGQLLRQEVYAEDGSDDEDRPYVVTQQRYSVRQMQPRRHVASMNGGNGGDGSSGGNGGAAKAVDQPYGAFLSHPLESLSIQYERNPADPRIGHELVLEVDHLGYPVKTATAAYGRKDAAALDPSVPVDPNAPPPPPSAPAPDPFHQKSGHLSASIVTLHHRLTDIGAGAGFGSSGNGNGVIVGAYRHGVQLAAQSYELHNGIFGDLTATADNGLLLPDAVLAALVGSGQAAITEISFDAAAPPAANERRLLSDTRTRYYDFSVAPPAGQSAPALPFATVPTDGPLILYSSYAKVLTADMLANVLQGNISTALLSEAGYLSATELALHNYPGSSSGSDLSDEAIAAAGTINDDGAYWAWSGYAEHDPSAFYQVTAATDVHGNVATISYDAHRLLAVGSTDPLGNVAAASNLDYRVLAPAKVTDINGNHAEAVFDVMGRVVRTAVMGKSGEGDAIASDAAATSTIVYELDRWMTEQLPARVTTSVRETHESDLATQTAGAATRWLTSIVYTGGSGQTVMSKATAAPGPAVVLNPDGSPATNAAGTDLVWVHTNPRWLASGRTVVDNKGNPIKQYEPYFSPTSDYEDDLAIVQWGVTPLMHYDPLGRLVRVDLPQGSYTKVAFSPWKQTSWDSNDTAATSGSSEPDEQSWYDQAAGWVRNAIAAHFDTPTVVHFDTLGRPVATVTHNKVSGGTGGGLLDEFATTAVKLDITGATLAVTDALGRDCMSYQYDMVGQPLTQVSIDSGSRWMLSTAAGEPVRHWGERSGGTGTPPPTGSDAGYPLRYEYDQLRRPTHVWLNEGNGSGGGGGNGGGGNGGGGNAAGEVLIERYFYGESHPAVDDVDPANPSGPTNPHNLRGQLLAHYDQAGGVFVADFDFKGQPTATTRRLTVDYAAVVDWAALAPIGAAGADGDLGSYDGGAVTVGTAATAAMAILDAEAFAHVFEYDALGRPFATTTPDGTIQRPVYYEGGQQHRLLANVRGAATANIIGGHTEYDAHGRRTYINKSDPSIAGGALMATYYYYDRESFRLTRVRTTRSSDNKVLQDLRYTYDAVGNILEIRDNAQAEVYFGGAVVSPTQRFLYDALYRLTAATGREHATSAEVDDTQTTLHTNPSNGAQLRNYSRSYAYDIVGNLLQLAHTVNGDPAAGWHRDYVYAAGNNRLQSTTVPGMPNVNVDCPHDVHGNMTAMPHLSVMEWDHADQLRHVDKGAGNAEQHVYFQYDSGGERVRKVWEHSGYRDERLYLGGFELWRRRNLADGALQEERETVHLSDSAGRVAMVETKTVDGGAAVGSPLARYRYQLDNHLGTVAVEVDAGGNVISYEEYHPYGTSAYRAEGAAIGVSRRRYRYTGKERDEETGLYYHGARYYAAWLGRWTAADPSGLVDGANLFAYVRGNPVALSDPSGTEAVINLPNVVLDGSEQNMFTLPEVVFGGADSATGVKIDSLGEGGPNPDGEPVALSQEFEEILGDAKAAGFSDDAMNTANEQLVNLIADRGGSEFFTRQGAMAQIQLRAEAMNHHISEENNFRAVVHGTYATVDTLSTSYFGDTVGETARNAALVVGTAGIMGLVFGYMALTTSPNLTSTPKASPTPKVAPGATGRVATRINLAKGRTRFTPLKANGEPVSAGWDHVAQGHFDRTVTRNRSIFSISQAELRSLLQSPLVVRSPARAIPGGQFVRTVDVGRTIGTSTLKRGGGATSQIKVFTDGAGNLISAFPH